jgi:hypothetical protein
MSVCAGSGKSDAAFCQQFSASCRAYACWHVLCFVVAGIVRILSPDGRSGRAGGLIFIHLRWKISLYCSIKEFIYLIEMVQLELL